MKLLPFVLNVAVLRSVVEMQVFRRHVSVVALHEASPLPEMRVKEMRKLTKNELRQFIVHIRKSFSDSDWGIAADTEEKRLRCVIRVMQVNLPLTHEFCFDEQEADQIVNELLRRDTHGSTS